MCGIAGIIDPGLRAVELRQRLRLMTDSLIHRGPDDEGLFVGEGVAVGMRRLSIIDVAGGHQPIPNEDERLWVVCNGEIYNHHDLRGDLAAGGHRFRTHSDTETIVHAYEEHGLDALAHLRGMFALAIWDGRTGELLLARDRLGKKPLYYAQIGDRLVFGSEIKALLAADPNLAEADPAALLPYLRFGFVPEPGTMYRRIRKLPAGHWLRFAHGEVTIAPYWRLPVGGDDAPERSLASVVEELDALLEESVRIRLMSEVPLGVFLSGGLDSSAVAAYAHKAGLRPLKTFTIGFDRPGWDESPDAALVARHLGTEHHVLELREEDLAADLPATVLTLVRHFDEPFGDASALPTYFVSKLAREHVTVILSGDGGDELFAGYYRSLWFTEGYKRLPDWLGRRLLPTLVDAAARALPAGPRYRALHAQEVLRLSQLPFETMYFSKWAVCSDDLLANLLGSRRTDLAGSLSYPADIEAVMGADLSPVAKAGYADVRFRLLEDMLVKVDRMSMAHSLEVRSPLLDHWLVEFAAGLPPSAKLRGGQTKVALREAVRPYLPEHTLRKRKQGFSVPLREWLRAGLREMVDDYLVVDGGRLPPDLFDRAAVRRLVTQHQTGQADHSAAIWLLINYAAWHDLYVRQPVLR